VPNSDDVGYRSWKETTRPDHAAMILYMMDVSGSMGREQKEIVRLVSFWIDTWLRSQYQSLETRYVVHDAVAKEVDQDTFYRLRESGGTKISSAYELCLQLMRDKYPSSEWNIYPFHFSDGDNWSSRDTERCVDAIVSDLLVRIEAMRRANGRDESSDRFERQSNQRFPSERASGGAGLGNTDLEIGDVVRAGMQFEIREQLTLVLRKLLFFSFDELDT